MRALFVDPGALRTELSLEASAPVADGLGGFSESWTEIGTVFAKTEPIAATSVFAADQTLETVTHRVTLRWRGDVSSGMRFVRPGRVLNIITVHDPDETGRYLVCRCREEGL